MTNDDRLRLGGEALVRHAWHQAWELLSTCDDDSPLQPGDLERLAVAAFLVSENEASDAAWTRAYQAYLTAGDRSGAVRSAFWIAFRLLNAGDLPSAGGWIVRVERALGEGPGESLERGQLAYLTGLMAVFSGDLDTAGTELEHAGRLAESAGVSDLSTLAHLALGRVLIFRGDVPGGLRLLDEAMVAVAAGELSPVVVGDSYCTAIDACHDLLDVRRGHAWTTAFGRWCESQDELVPFAGVCLIHRSEFLQLKGAWVEAMAQAELARRRLSSPVVHQALGAAIYQQGELHRLRGELEAAYRCYRLASSHGKDPQPGLALLRLAEGDGEAAVHGIRRALAEAGDRLSRPGLLAAQIEATIAVDDLTTAGEACDELGDIARMVGSPMLTAIADRAAGAIQLAAGDGRAALAPLRRASSVFRDLGAAYDMARTGILIAAARRALDDDEGADLEFAASRRTLNALGVSVIPPVGAVRVQRRGTTGGGPLSAREVQVLHLVSQGLTNRAIGVELHVSERTIDRHVSNILAKLGVPSRAAATAWAYERNLL